MFELIELIKEAKEFKRYWEKRGNDHFDRKVQRAYLQGKIDAYQHILETEYPDWEDIYEFAKLSKQNTK